MQPESDSDETDAAAAPAPSAPRKLWAAMPPGLRRFAVAMGILIVVWGVFVQFAPRVLFNLPESAPSPAPMAEIVPDEPAMQEPEPAPEPSLVMPETPPPAVEEIPAPTVPELPLPLPPVEAEAPPPAPPAPPPPDPRLQEMESKLDHLLTLIAQQSGSVSGAVLEQLQHQLTAQSAELAALKARQEEVLHMVALLQAYERLRKTAETGNFSPELEAMRALVNDPELSKTLANLRYTAPRGIPNMDAIRQLFDTTTRLALRTSAAENAGWFTRFKANLSALITIRKTGLQQGDSVEDIIARAETRVAENRLEDAVRELGQLPPEMQKTYANWVSLAAMRTGALAALEHLHDAIVSSGSAPVPAADTQAGE